MACINMGGGALSTGAVSVPGVLCMEQLASPSYNLGISGTGGQGRWGVLANRSSQQAERQGIKGKLLTALRHHDSRIASVDGALGRRRFLCCLGGKSFLLCAGWY